MHATVFESFVNSEGCKAVGAETGNRKGFESFVNSEGCKASAKQDETRLEFESFVNSEGCKALSHPHDGLKPV